MTWEVMPLCAAQLLDVNPQDILNNGLYRRCNTYKGGGGYDQFPGIYQKRNGYMEGLNNQFVVQLKGCPLDCPYCYVTRAGIWGNSQRVSTEELLQAFKDSKCIVFHLMGGAPALYVDSWHEILEGLNSGVFHSDLLLVEGEYKSETIHQLSAFKNTLYAISIKGSTPEEFYTNTRRKLNEGLFWRNLDVVVSQGLPFYFTYTGLSIDSINSFSEKVVDRYQNPSLLDDQFSIELKHYKALDSKERGDDSEYHRYVYST